MVATTLVGLTRDVVQADPDRDAYVELDRRVTYGQYERAADGLATLLASMGVGKGDVVCLTLPSSIDYAICYQAALRLGAITSGINMRLGPLEQTNILTQLRPLVTISEDGAAPDGPTGLVLERSALAAGYALDPSYEAPVLHADDPVTVVWTSGTTAMPKGAVYDNARMAVMAAGAAPMSQPGDVRIYPLPFAHTGYMTRLWDEISNAITCVITPVRWSADVGLTLLERERVTVGQGVPTQWDLMLRHPRFEECDFSAMRIAAIGAASIPAELVRQVRRRFNCPVVVRYTSTEACITTSTSPEDPVEVVATTVGKPVAGVELELVDLSGQPVPGGAVGQIRCRSGAVMKGYWRDAERTAQVLDAEGWLTTGDLAYVDDDGNLRITGRMQDMYIRGGYNVYPVQVEDALLSHPKVDDVAVLGVPDPVLGEIGMAFVVSTTAPAPTLDELKQWTRTALADYKAPDKLKVVDEIPRNAMGKIDRRALAAQLEQSAAAGPVTR